MSRGTHVIFYNAVRIVHAECVATPTSRNSVTYDCTIFTVIMFVRESSPQVLQASAEREMSELQAVLIKCMLQEERPHPRVLSSSLWSQINVGSNIGVADFSL